LTATCIATASAIILPAEATPPILPRSGFAPGGVFCVRLGWRLAGINSLAGIIKRARAATPYFIISVSKGKLMRDQSNRIATAAALLVRAGLCRRAVGIPTMGGHRTDSILLDLADQLEREAGGLVPRGRPSSPDDPRQRADRAAHAA
jgi:hypothetical protein